MFSMLKWGQFQSLNGTAEGASANIEAAKKFSKELKTIGTEVVTHISKCLTATKLQFIGKTAKQDIYFDRRKKQAKGTLHQRTGLS